MQGFSPGSGDRKWTSDGLVSGSLLAEAVQVFRGMLVILYTAAQAVLAGAIELELR